MTHLPNPKSTKFATSCARCGLPRGQHAERTLHCPGPYAVPQSFKRPSDKRKA